MFAAPDRTRGILVGIAGAGVSPSQLKKLSFPTRRFRPPSRQGADQRQPGLVSTILARRVCRRSATVRSPSVKIGGDRATNRRGGLMLISPATDLSHGILQWLVSALDGSLQRVGFAIDRRS